MNYYFQLARQALCEAVRLIGEGEPSVIAVPRFICSDVPAALRDAGHDVVYYEVDHSMQPALSESAPTCDALIAVNYFGFPSSIDDIVTAWGIGRDRIIEDNAHGLFSRDSNGVPLGTRTLFGVTSFRKSIRVADGGILHVNDGRWALHPTPSQLDPIRRRASTGFVLRSCASALESFTHAPIMNIVRGVKRRVHHSVPLSTSSAWKPLPVSLASVRTLEATECSQETRRRRAEYESISPLIESAGGTLLFPVLPDNVVPYGVPFLGDQTVVRTVVRRIFWRGNEVFSWPDLPENSYESSSWQKNVYLVSFLQ